ncbi:flagellar biosynthesis anti-sigma factor FlgM [Desulfobacter postgatei]|jgi:negative regulator of flagellin synthesis FlgM|uniref:flagellar biosynthesis anti-sigma factor FlgM n=1 Tax=Desulfobacter postgatei TaxID=2293 RepID=UPI002A35F05A|nr:flagellar biosynthesis anti-sigma factor FlgM [Desulfobacter postgatei]MDX9963044.1 flagellar biosynthesis anti-sigma factor FlgM [Desulfobacter postgatei]
MKINSTQQYINQSYAANNAKANTSASANTPADQGKQSEETLSDTINLSSTTRDLQKISAASAEEPKGRAQMVENLKLQVQSNQYTVNAEQVAEKMIGSIMNEVG